VEAKAASAGTAAAGATTASKAAAGGAAVVSVNVSVSRCAAMTAAAGAAAVAAADAEADAEAAKTPKKSTGSGASDAANQFPGELAIDRRVRVFWPEEADFFAGLVTAHNANTGSHTIRYDDGDVEVELGRYCSPRHRCVIDTLV